MLVIRNRLRKFFHSVLANFLLGSCREKESFLFSKILRSKRKKNRLEFSGRGNYFLLCSERSLLGNFSFDENSFSALNSRLNEATKTKKESDGMLIVESQIGKLRFIHQWRRWFVMRIVIWMWRKHKCRAVTEIASFPLHSNICKCAAHRPMKREQQALRVPSAKNYNSLLHNFAINHKLIFVFSHEHRPVIDPQPIAFPPSNTTPT